MKDGKLPQQQFRSINNNLSYLTEFGNESHYETQALKAFLLFSHRRNCPSVNFKTVHNLARKLVFTNKTSDITLWLILHGRVLISHLD